MMPKKLYRHFSRPAKFRSASIGLSAALFTGWIQTVAAQEALNAGGQKRLVAIVPRVSITETLTDNVSLATNGRQSEQITEVSPGIRITRDTGLVKAYFDYAVNGRVYAQNTAPTTLQNALTAFGSVEAVNNWAFVDFSGSISRQSISAFGPQSSGSSNINSNQTEYSTFRVSPYVRGKFGSAVDYEARYGVTTSSSQSSLVSDVTTRDGLIRLSGRGSGSRLGWSLDAGQQNVSYGGAGRATESANLTGQLSYAVAPKLNISLTAGQEANNFSTFDRQTYATYGGGIGWAPLDATKLSASRQTHSFGQSHSLGFEHRTAKTAWRLSDSQSVSSSPSQPGVMNLGSVYDLFFEQFASIEPDLVKRAALVNNFLQVTGINPNTIVVNGVLTSAVSLQRRQDLSIALLGLRGTLTFLANRSESSRLDTISSVRDDLSNSSLLRQNGLSASYAHRLTPITAVNLLVSSQQSSASTGLLESTMKSVNLSMSTRVGPHSTATVSARRVVFDSQTTPYTESAITGTLSVQF
jgi:uncharacterized protein (PEP-CTERM system associated)